MKRIIFRVTFLLTCMLLFLSVGARNTQAAPVVKRVTLKSVDNIDTTCQKIRWKKIKGITGYQIYYKKSGAKFRKLVTLNSSKKSYTIKKLETNKKYIYKVRAYKRSSEKTIYGKFSKQLGKKTTNYLMNLVQPYSTAFQGYSDYTAPESVSLGGKNYTNGFGLDPGGYAFFNLAGKYSKISFTTGVRDGATHDCSFSILSDDSVVKTIEIKANALPKKYTVNIENASKLEFRGVEGWIWNDISIVDIKVYK